ncbi:MAG: hypothetical protein WBO36_06950 [Saprospiraceae bacterium]
MRKEEIDIRLKSILLSITQLPNEKINSVTKFEDWGFVNLNFGRGFVNLSLNEFSCALNAEIRITEIENIWDDFSIELELFHPVHSDGYISDRLLQIDGPSTFFFSPKNYLIEGIDYFGNELNRRSKYNLFPITDIGFNQLEEKYTWIFHDLFLPKLKETLDIKFLDSTINDKVEMIDGTDSDFFLNVHGLIFRRIILAKLSSNPLYNDICDYHISKMPSIIEMSEKYQMPHLKKYPEVLESVIERLKGVKPMSDTRLVLDLS